MKMLLSRFAESETRITLPFALLLIGLVIAYILICVLAAKDYKKLSGVCVVITTLLIVALVGMKVYHLDRVPVEEHHLPAVVAQPGYEANHSLVESE